MLLYRYDKDTKEYIGSIPACLDPMASQREGKPVYAILKDSTTIEPPFEGGKVAIFNGNGWTLVPDYRGRTVYRTTTGNPLLITEIGNIPPGYSLEKPVFLQDLKIEKIQEVTNLCNHEFQRLIEVKELEVKVSDRPYLLNKLEETKGTNYLVISIEDRGNKVLERKNVQYVANYLYLREVFLSIKKNEIVKEINKCKNKQEIDSIIIDFDISSRIDGYAEKSLHEIEKYIKRVIEG